ncbi:hypothetical protein LXL04_022305 [Taraxacum kok-saghyz]
MMTDSSTGTITHSGDGGGSGVNSPSSRRSLSCPWAQVVRGVIEPDSVHASLSPGVAEQIPVITDPVAVVEALTETPPESFNDNNTCNAGGVKKSAWNKPSANGVVDVAATPVMGAASWPALSESTRPGMKSMYSSSESSSTPTSDGSLTVPLAPVASQPRPNQVKPNANHANPGRQRPIRRGGGTTGGVSTGFNARQSPLPPPFPLYDVFGNFVPAVPTSTSAREQPLFKENNWSPRPAGGVVPNRRNNFGPRPRGGGVPYVNNGYGGRRDHHDRDWRGPRGHGPRDVHMQHQIAPPPPLPRGYIPAPAPFIPPPSIRPYGAPMAYDMAASYVYLPTLPSEPYRAPHRLPQAPPVPMFVPLVEPPLHVKILTQIEYYFSEDNLVKDDFLRSNMDGEGWVSITLIAGFPRVQSLTNDTQMILNTLKDSSTVELQGEKIRSRDWRRWVQIPNRFQVSENLTEGSMQKLTMEDDEVAGAGANGISS